MSGNIFNSVNQIECRYMTEDDVLRQYVAGLLPEAAAEEFEQHLFECDACAEEVQRAIEIRAVLPAARRDQRRSYSLLAVAASAAIIAIGYWQVHTHQEALTPPPLRSVGTRQIVASGRLVGTTFTASWRVVPDARSYRVQVFDSVGEPVTWTETSSTKFSAPIGYAPRSEPRYWKVQALDDDHVIIASSELLKIESR